jgi:steroid delta-isomerase-like uncharacterized protein
MFSRIKAFLFVCLVLFCLDGIFLVTACASEAEMRAAMQGMIEAVNTHDVTRMSSYWTDDIVYDFAAQPPSLYGKQEVAAFFEGLFQGVPDFHSTQTRVLVSGDIMVTEAVATGTHLGELSGIPATGSGLQLAPLQVWEFEGDKIKRGTEYLDMASMLMQIGLMPTPDLDPAILVPSFPLPDAEPTGLTPLEAGLELDRLYDAHDLVNYAKNIHPDAEILLVPLGIPLNRDMFIAVLELYFLGFPDLSQDISRSLDLGDGWVMFEGGWKGMNDGPYFGMPATRRYSEVRGAWISRVDADGLLTNLSVYFDNITILANLGLFPPPNPEANKTLERRVFEEIWNEGLLDVADEVFAPDAVLHLGTDDIPGAEGFKQYVAGYRVAFPDIHWTVEDQVAEGDIVVTRLTGTGTHLGELMGIPATGQQITATAIATVRIAQGKIQDSWSSWDALGLMQQLGVMPSTGNDYTWGAPGELIGDPGDPATNTALVLYVVQKFWNEHNVAVLDNTHGLDAIAHNPVIPGHPLPFHMYKHACLLHLAAFPDFRVTTESIIAEGDKVAISWTVNGTHLGELMGIAPTGRPVKFTGSTVYRLADGKIAENWWSYDALGMMQQITAPSEPEPPEG